jgi:hypothetical protein
MPRAIVSSRVPPWRAPDAITSAVFLDRKAPRKISVPQCDHWLWIYFGEFFHAFMQRQQIDGRFLRPVAFPPSWPALVIESLCDPIPRVLRLMRARVIRARMRRIN